MTIRSMTIATTSALALIAGSAFAESENTRVGDTQGSDAEAAEMATDAPDIETRVSQAVTMDAVKDKTVRADYADEFVNNMSELSAMMMEERINYSGGPVGAEVVTNDDNAVGTVRGYYEGMNGRTMVIVETADSFEYDRNMFAIALKDGMAKGETIEIPSDRPTLEAELGAAFSETPR